MRLVFVILLALLPAYCWSSQKPISGYICSVPPETPSTRDARHEAIAKKRLGTIINVHRGGYAFAPENTLEAYNASMNYGADAVEIDVRRSADGVLYVLHDPSLARVTNRFGLVSGMSYYELLSADLEKYGAATNETRIPTLAAVLELARQRRMMLEVDVKDPGIEDDIAEMFDAADVWDHVLNFSEWNADKLLANPKFKLVPSAAYLPDGRRDMDPETIRSLISRKGVYITVDDPRLIAQMMGRKQSKSVPLPTGLRMNWLPCSQESEESIVGSPAYVRALGIDPDSQEQILAVLKTDISSRTNINNDKQYQAKRGEQIWKRAWAAYLLGISGSRSSQVICWLEYQVKNRSLHPDWVYNGLDGVAAIKAIAACGSVDSVPVLIDRYKTTDPALAGFKKLHDTANPLSWYDGSIHEAVLEALGDLACLASKQFLMEYMAMDETAVKQLGHPMYNLAATSLLRQNLSRTEMESMLNYHNTTVRGIAIQYCVDHPCSKYDAALKAVAPWALKLPQAKQ